MDTLANPWGPRVDRRPGVSSPDCIDTSPSHPALAMSGLFPYIRYRTCGSAPILFFVVRRRPESSIFQDERNRLFSFISLSLVSRQRDAIMYAQSRFLIDAAYLRHVSPVAGKTREKNNVTSYTTFRYLLCRHAVPASICFLLQYVSASITMSICDLMHSDNVDSLQRLTITLCACPQRSL